MRGFTSLALFAVVLATLDTSRAFVPAKFSGSQAIGTYFSSGSSSILLRALSDDVSIPYDSTVELAYANWIETNKKPYDAGRYETFKENYLAITVMNMAAKKQSREDGSTPSLLALNEYADCTAEEFEAAMNGGDAAADEEAAGDEDGGVLGKAVANAESQMAASSALQDAADALEKEEEMLAAKLGLGSVEELEEALDSMEGIAPDGGELDTGSLSREARVRSAYLDWCKEYDKESDESRYGQFASNYLEMESFAKESGKEMLLNQYADCTEEEFEQIMKGDKPKSPAPVSSGTSKEASAAKEKAEASRKEAAAAEAAAKKAKAAAAAKKDVEANRVADEARRTKAEAEQVSFLAEKRRIAAMDEAEYRKAIDKEKSDRQAAQSKEFAKEAQSAESAVIAAAKAEAEKQAAAVAKIRKIEEDVAEMARKKARDWKEKQAKLEAAKPRPPKTPPKKKPVIQFFGSPKGTTSKAPPKAPQAARAAAPKAPAKKKATPKGATAGLSSFFSAPAAKKAPPKAAVKKSPPKAASKAPAGLSSFFESKLAPAPKAAVARPPAPAPKPKARPPRPTLNLGAIFNSPKKAAPKKPAAKKAAPKKPAAKKVAPAPKAAPAQKKSPSKPMFSFGSPKPAPKKSPPPPPPAPSRPTFSLFGPKPAPPPPPAPAPAPKKAANPFSFFGGAKPAPPPPPPPAPAPKRPTLSLFGNKKPAPAPAPPAPKASPRPTLSLFGRGKPKGSVAPKAASSKRGAAKKAAPKDNIPVLAKWKQNPDGSITGSISNSKSFRTGTKITTSPIRKGAKAGLVRTSSGSQYRLS